MRRIALWFLIMGVMHAGALSAAEETNATSDEQATDQQADDQASASEDSATKSDTNLNWQKYLRREVHAPGKKRGRRYRAKEKSDVEIVIEAGEDAEEEIIDVNDRRLDLQKTSKDTSAWQPHGPVREKSYERRREVDGASRLVRE